MNFSVGSLCLFHSFQIERDSRSLCSCYYLGVKGIFNESDIALIIKLAQKSTAVSLWISVTYIDHQNLEKKLKLELKDFLVLKDELNLPLRNTASITRKAYNIDKGD